MFCAVFPRPGRGWSDRVADTVFDAMAPFTPPDRSGHWTGARAHIAQAIWHNTRQSQHEAAPEICAATGRVIAAWVRLDNRADLCGDLRLDAQDSLTDPQIILAAHRAWGADCVSRLEGDFSFVLYDPQSDEVLAARDSLGARPLFYTVTDQLVCLGTSIPALGAVPGVSLSLSAEWVARYISVNAADLVKTAYTEVHRLPPAHLMRLDAQREISTRRYFDFDLSAPSASAYDPAYVQDYRDAFEAAVGRRTRSAYLIGAESSGGLDSSSIVGALARRLPHARDDFHVFGMCASEKETSYILKTSALADVRHNHILTRPKQLDRSAGIDRAIAVLGHPPEHIQPLMHLSFYDLCQHYGIRTLFSGFGGDEVATSYADWQRWEFWHEGNTRALLRALPGSGPMRLARTLRMRGRVPPAPSSQHRGFIDLIVNLTPYAESARDSFGLDQLYAPVFAAQDTAKTLNEATAWAVGFQRSHIPRLETYALFGQSYGIEYRWPLLDRRLIQQWFHTPAIHKRKGAMDRYLHRQAVADLIPPEIAGMAGKDMGPPVGGGYNKTHPVLGAAADLPPLLRDILDAKAVDSLLAEVRASGGDLENHIQIKRLILFHIDVLARWLNRD